MGDCVPRALGRLLAMGVSEVERAMTGRIEELRAQQKERNEPVDWPAPRAPTSAELHQEAEAALTEALDIADNAYDEGHLHGHAAGQAVGYTLGRQSLQTQLERLAKQGRLLERAKVSLERVVQVMGDDWWMSTSFIKPLLSDLASRSVPCMYCNDTGWVEDKNYEPEAHERGFDREPGRGLIRCGAGCDDPNARNAT